MENREKEKLIAKLLEAKRKPESIFKTDKKTGVATQYYYAGVSIYGKRHQITSQSLPDFIAKIDSILKQLNAPEGKDGKVSIPIKEAFNIYLQEVRLPKLQDYSEERRMRNYRHDFIAVGLVCKFFLSKGIEYFDHIDENAVQAYKYHCIHERKNSPTTFGRRLTILISLNRYIKNYTAYSYSECNFEKFAIHDKRQLTNYLTEQQVQDLLANSSIHLQRLIKFFIYTGLRKQNGLDLKWVEVDFKNRQITTQIKQNKTHTVPIIQPLFELLNEIRSEQMNLYGTLHEYVFLYHGKRLLNGTSAIKNSLRRAGIELPKGQLFHVFRHTCAVTLINKGVDLYTVQKILGHSSPVMTQRYARLQTSTMATAMEKAFS